MNLTLFHRATWQLTTQPVVGPRSIPGSVVRIAIHYTAAPKIPADIPAYLRAIQADYTTNRGYSIGYNFAVDRLGKVWECRGLDLKCAANVGFNDTTIAILCLVDGDAPAHDLMVGAVRDVVSLIRTVAPGARRVVGHQQIGSTACPGAGLQAQVIAGTFEPLPETEDDDVKYLAIKSPGRGWAIVAHDGAGVEMIGCASDADRDALIAAYGATRVNVSDTQWDDYVAHHKASKPVPVGG